MQSQQAEKRIVPITIAAVGCSTFLLICCCCGIFSAMLNPPTPTPVISSEQTQTPINNPASETTLLPPDENHTPTPTIFIFELQTNVARPTNTLHPTKTPVALATPQIQPTSPPSACNPSYPDVCINSSPRLSCADLKTKGIYHFRVLPPDPLGYDKDNDGIGCE